LVDIPSTKAAIKILMRLLFFNGVSFVLRWQPVAGKRGDAG
jgi:hypothetical protein